MILGLSSADGGMTVGLKTVVTVVGLHDAGPRSAPKIRVNQWQDIRHAKKHATVILSACKVSVAEMGRMQFKAKVLSGKIWRF